MKAFLNLKNKKIVIPAIVIGALAIVFAMVGGIFDSGKANDEVVVNKKKVETVKVNVGGIKQFLTVVGYTQDGYVDVGYTGIQGKVQKIYVKPNSVVSKGDRLFKIDSTGSVAQFQLQLTQLELKETEMSLLLDQLRIQKEKTSKLFDAGAVSESELTAIKNQEAQLINQRNQIVEQAADTKVKIGRLEELGTALSPNDGVIEKIEMKEGAYLTEKDYVRVSKSQKPMAEFYLTEETVNYFEKGKEVSVNIPSLDLKVVGIVNEILPGGGKDYLYPVKVELQMEEKIKGGLIANLDIATYENEKAMLVPTKSVIEFNNEVFVYVLDDKSIVRKKIVKKGVSENGMTEILQGLNLGERVVSSGQLAVSDGEQVE